MCEALWQSQISSAFVLRHAINAQLAGAKLDPQPCLNPVLSLNLNAALLRDLSLVQNLHDSPVMQAPPPAPPAGGVDIKAGTEIGSKVLGTTALVTVMSLIFSPMPSLVLKLKKTSDE